MKGIAPQRLVILSRHGRTPANDARERGMAESRVQGFSKEMPLDVTGEQQADSFGRALGSFIAEHSVQIISVHSSDAVRALSTRDRALAQAGITPLLKSPDIRLRELHKGDLEGMLRSDAYPTAEIRKQQAIQWHFRHGTPESGGETAYEAGLRWLGWFNEAVANDFNSSSNSSQAIIVFGHNLVTSYGLWLLNHPETTKGNLPALTETLSLKTDNGTAIVLAEQTGSWHEIERIIPAE